MDVRKQVDVSIKNKKTSPVTYQVNCCANAIMINVHRVFIISISPTEFYKYVFEVAISINFNANLKQNGPQNYHLFSLIIWVALFYQRL